MEHLTQKTFSVWTVTHSCDTAQGMPSWVLANTVNTFTRPKNISTEHGFNNFTKESCHLFSFSTKPHYTHTCFWSLYPPYVTATLYVYMILCLHTTRPELSQPGNHGTLLLLEANPCHFWHKWLLHHKAMMHSHVFSHFSMQHSHFPLL